MLTVRKVVGAALLLGVAGLIFYAPHLLRQHGGVSPAPPSSLTGRPQLVPSPPGGVQHGAGRVATSPGQADLEPVCPVQLYQVTEFQIRLEAREHRRIHLDVFACGPSVRYLLDNCEDDCCELGEARGPGNGACLQSLYGLPQLIGPHGTCRPLAEELTVVCDNADGPMILAPSVVGARSIRGARQMVMIVSGELPCIVAGDGYCQ